MIGLPHFLFVSVILFGLGLLAVLTKKNAVTVLMGIELILNAANINFIAFSRFVDVDMDGQMMAIFVIVTAAASAAVALAIVLNMYQRFKSINLDQADSLAN